jgi:hypothetical protein
MFPHLTKPFAIVTPSLNPSETRFSGTEIIEKHQTNDDEFLFLVILNFKRHYRIRPSFSPGLA